MTGRGARGAAGWLLCLLLAACGSDPGPDLVFDAGGDDALFDEAGLPIGPTDIVIAAAPPIELPGTVLWLDGNFGVARAGNEVRAWTDRSGLGHVFEEETAEEPGVTAERLGAHGALHFNGRSRLVLAPATDEKGQAALTIGDQDFLLALVLRHDGNSTPATLLALSPRIDPTVVAPLDALVALELDPALTLTLVGRGNLANRLEAKTLEPGPRLVVVSSVGAEVKVVTVSPTLRDENVWPAGRLEGQIPDGKRLELPFLVPYVGGWDFDGAGLTGLVAETAMVIGPEVAAAAAPLEAYLRQKHGL